MTLSLAETTDASLNPRGYHLNIPRQGLFLVNDPRLLSLSKCRLSPRNWSRTNSIEMSPAHQPGAERRPIGLVL